ncbi:MAG TPA: c-type cytochrome [Gemmatimonadales bacterium]|nr:c-type cytochrome [Gemmatimonadales bacterium]
MTPARVVFLFATAATLGGCPPAAAQGRFPPDSFKNLKVLSKTISQRALLDTMRGFALALGVRCVYCHVGKEGQPLDSVNFASDDKRTKKVARVMLHMVMHINEEHLADVPDRPKPVVVVRCATCHRGIARPRLLDDDLALMLADSGLDATVARYRALRQRYYGSGSYDFGELVLNQLARAEAQAGRFDNSLGLLKLNAEFYPASTQIAFLEAEVSLQRGDTAAAIAGYRDALAKDSTNMGARRRLAALGAGPRP